VSRRVALLNFAFWPEVQRGSERIVHDLAADLAARGHRPRLITSHPGPSTTSTEDGFEIVRNRRPPDAPLRLRRFQDNLTHVPLSYLTLRRGEDELAHAFYQTDALASVAWARKTGRPAVFSYMGIPSRATATYTRGRMKIIEHVIDNSDAVIGLSKTACDALWRWWGVEARLIYPGVDLSAFGSGAGGSGAGGSSTGRGSGGGGYSTGRGSGAGGSAGAGGSGAVQRAEHPTIACAASPDDERKRVPLLVEAFARVRKEHPHARLVLMRPTSPRLAQQLGGDGIEFFNPSPSAVADVFSNAWISALPSKEEAFGLVVVESLATGTPVVAANEAGPAEILNGDGLGALFDEPTPEAVAKALLEALDLNGTADLARARAADFTSERCAIEHEALYEELLAR
jgi:glycosyltransferase involved in cell wall biosynthesis